jgi:hypothetical protein
VAKGFDATLGRRLNWRLSLLACYDARRADPSLGNPYFCFPEISGFRLAFPNPIPSEVVAICWMGTRASGVGIGGRRDHDVDYFWVRIT